MVVDDGGNTPPKDVVALFRSELDVTVVTQPHAGPATARFGPHAAGWLLMLLVSAGVAGVASGALRDAPGATFVLAARASALWYLVLCLPALVPAYLTPHYSIPRVSRQLATLLADVAEPIGSSGVDGLFREGRLHYLTVHRAWPMASSRTA